MGQVLKGEPGGEFSSQLCHRVPSGSSLGHLISLSLSSPTCKVGVMMLFCLMGALIGVQH